MKDLVAIYVTIIAMLAPLLLIPYAFKIAGGILGRTHDLLTNYGKKAHQGILGNPNDQNSLRNRVRTKLGAGVVESRAQFQTRNGNRRFGLGRASRMIGGGPAIYDRQAANIQKSMQHMKTTNDYGHDGFVRAATISPKRLAALRQSGDPKRYRAAGTAGNDSGHDQWASADGAWHTESEIRAANKHFSTPDQKIGAFSRVLEKADSGTKEEQDNAWEDYKFMANEMGMDKDTATGKWQGIAIPYKGIRSDMRRFKLEGERGQLVQPAGMDGYDWKSHLKETANSKAYDQIALTEGSFETQFNSIQEAFRKDTGGTFVHNEEVRKNAANSANNLRNFAAGDQTKAATAGAAASGQPGYATADGGAYKNTQEAKARVRQIEADVNLRNDLNAYAIPLPAPGVAPGPAPAPTIGPHSPGYWGP